MTQQTLMANADMRARLALEAGHMGSWVASLTQNTAAGDDAVCRMFNIPQSDEPRPIADFLEHVHIEDQFRLEEAMARSRDHGEEYRADFRVRHGDEWCWFAGRGRLTHSEDGEILLVGVNWDITGRKAEEERLSILAQEMDHRVKNAYSVMLALVRLGSRSASSIKSFTDTLTAQLRAMADAHRMSTTAAQLEHQGSARLAQIVRMAVAPWLTANAERVVIEEKVAANLPLGQLSAFAMLTYELATNAAKYGALSCPDGHLVVTIDRADDGLILFSWDETADHETARLAREEQEIGSEAGFGTTLLNHCVATLKARLKRELRPSGLLVELRLPGNAD